METCGIQGDVEEIIQSSEEVVYGDLLNDISNLRKKEASAKDFSRTLKFNYVECKSKQMFLEALKHEMNISSLSVDFPSEEELKHHKALARSIQTENKALEEKLMKQVAQMNEYRKLLKKVSPVQEITDENVSPANGTLEVKSKKYMSMLTWYESVIKSIQVLSGIAIQEYIQTDAHLVLVVGLKFSSHSVSLPQQKHTLRIMFHTESGSIADAELIPNSVKISDITNRAKKLDNVKFLVREIRARLIHSNE